MDQESTLDALANIMESLDAGTESDVSVGGVAFTMITDKGFDFHWGGEDIVSLRVLHSQVTELKARIENSLIEQTNAYHREANNGHLDG